MALFTLTINNLSPALEKKNQELAVIAQYLHFAARDAQAAGGALTSGNIVDNRGAGSITVGSWTYTPQASS
jgi:hypothetical protein